MKSKVGMGGDVRSKRGSQPGDRFYSSLRRGGRGEEAERVIRQVLQSSNEGASKDRRNYQK